MKNRYCAICKDSTESGEVLCKKHLKMFKGVQSTNWEDNCPLCKETIVMSGKFRYCYICGHDLELH